MSFSPAFSAAFPRPFGGVTAAATTLFYDTFTGANGTAINSRAPNIDVVGGGWTVATGAIAIQSNRAQASVNLSRASANVNDADVTITHNITLASSVSGGIMARFTDANNHWVAIASQGANLHRIFERTSGTQTLRATQATAPIGVGTQYNHSVVTSGTNITATFASETPLAYSSAAHQTVTRHGIYLDSGCTSDDFKVEP